MPIDELQREVATIALRTAARHGFALAGGNALIAHGVIDRPTDDVDLFSDQETAVDRRRRGRGSGPAAGRLPG